MKKEYDFNELTCKHGFNIREIEKVCRIARATIVFLASRCARYKGKLNYKDSQLEKKDGERFA